MNIYETIKELASAKKISIAQLERELDFSNGSINKWSTTSPSIDKIEKVANKLNVTIDELLGYEPNSKKSLAEQYGAFAFDGEPISDEEMEFLLSVLEAKRKTEKK